MLPTHRQSPSRSRKRRSHNALRPDAFALCPVTGLAKQHHRVSKSSGYVRPGLTIRVPKLGIGTD